MQGITVTFLWTSLVALSADANDENSCRTPENRRGTCISINSCPALINLLSHPPLNTQDEEFLQKSGCGFEGTTPKVCCPLSSESSPEETRDSERQSWTSDVTSTQPPTRQLLPHYPECGPAFPERILGGGAELGSVPWIALLGYVTDSRRQIQWLCEGSLISDRYVLVPAHCVHNISEYHLVRVRLGEYDMSNDGQDCDHVCAPSPVDVSVEGTIFHFRYNQPYLRNDIALVRLSKPVQFSQFVRPICLPSDNLSANDLGNLDAHKQTIMTYGWNSTNSRKYGSLQQRKTNPVPHSICADFYRKEVQLGTEQFCGTVEWDTESCLGDSLVLFQNKDTHMVAYLAGIRTLLCGSGKPALYTHMNPYLRWIMDNIRP